MSIANFNQLDLVLSKYMPRSVESAYVLDRMLLLMKLLGNPQNSYPVIHVAGTSGKTSTCYYLASLLSQRYKKIGLTVSPHIVEVNERVQVNLTPLPEKLFCSEFNIFSNLVDKFKITPTYFELLVGFAFWEFARQDVDYAVVEVGLGGLLDATNVIDRRDKISVITDIGYDHVNILGKTLAKIATQKAGIIHPGNQIFCYKYGQKAIVLKTIAEKAGVVGAELHLLEKTNIYRVSFLPDFQMRNFGLASAVIEYVLANNKLPALNGKELPRAAKILIPGRMETMIIGNKTVILDGAHNSQKLHALMESVTSKYPDVPIAGLVSFVAGREYRLDSSLDEISAGMDFLILTSFENKQDFHHQSVDPNVIASMLNRRGFNKSQVIVNLKIALKALLERPEKVLVITGSFYFLCKIRPYILDLN